MKILLFLLLSITFASRAQKKTVEGDVAISVTYKKDSILPNGVHQQTISGPIKRALFYDEKGVRISKDKFYNSIDHKVNIQGFTETDTVVSYKLYTRRRYLTISDENSKIIRDYLAEITAKAVDSSQIIMIHFYSGVLGEPSGFTSLHWKANEKEFVKKLPKDVHVQQFFIYKYDFGNDVKAQKNGWTQDKTGLIENTFLPTHFNHNSGIVIMPDGRCYTYYGEHGTEMIREGLDKFLADDRK